MLIGKVFKVNTSYCVALPKRTATRLGILPGVIVSMEPTEEGGFVIQPVPLNDLKGENIVRYDRTRAIRVLRVSGDRPTPEPNEDGNGSGGAGEVGGLDSSDRDDRADSSYPEGAEV